MSYRLRKKRLAREVHRVAREELEGILKELLTLNDEHPGQAIHEARKHLKKIRALIRLLRPAMGNAFSKRENAAFRDTARQMSPIRDAHVRVQTIRKLNAAFRKRHATAAFQRIRAAMAAGLKRALAERDESEWNKHVAAETERALCRLDIWPLKRIKARFVRDGVKAACRKARRALAAVRRDGSDANLHELRKTVKTLWYDLRLLGADGTQPIKVLTRRLRDLGQKLGDDHDLAMLMAVREDAAPPAHADWEKLEKAIAARRQRLQKTALRRAGKLLAPKSGAFADFVVSQWKA